MWHEARKHEKKLRVLIVDYRRRAERRREYYEKFKADPAQFMQVHGRACKIHMDPQITAAADNCLMPWQGDTNVMIDRFDARAHLDRIPDSGTSDSKRDKDGEAGCDKEEEVALNYERYRILIQNDLAGVSEEKFLQQIYAEEQFGTPTPGLHTKASLEQAKPRVPKAAIGFNYEDSTHLPGASSAGLAKTSSAVQGGEDDESDEDIDFDLLVNVKDLNVAQQAELNSGGVKYGMAPGDFMRFLNADLEEKEQMRLAKLQEEEKQAMSGRKARRERRAYKDRLIMRKGYISPPSYAARNNDSAPREDNLSSGSESKSRSPSTEKITFITSFGGNDSDSERKRLSKYSEQMFGPVLPPEALARKWLRRRSLSRSPKRRKSRSTSRSNQSVERRGNHSSRRRRSSSSSRHSAKRRHSTNRGSRGGRNRSNSRRSSRSSSPARSRSRRSRRSRSRSRGHRRSSSQSRRRRRSHDGHSRKHSRKHRKSSSSRRKRSRSHSRSPKKRYSSSDSSSSSSVNSRRSKSPTAGSTLGAPPGDRRILTGVDDGVAPKLPSPPVKRYYDRAKAAHKDENDDSVHSSDSSDEHVERRSLNSADSTLSPSVSVMSNKASVSTSSKVGSSTQKLTPQERLRRRMQAALNRQLKADKEAERSRIEKQVQERMEREESLRELSIKYRRREREKRHRNLMLQTDSSKSSDSSSESRSRSRSRSRSPR